MKKIITIFAVSLVLNSFVACKKKTSQPEPENPTSNSSSVYCDTIDCLYASMNREYVFQYGSDSGAFHMDSTMAYAKFRWLLWKLESIPNSNSKFCHYKLVNPTFDTAIWKIQEPDYFGNFNIKDYKQYQLDGGHYQYVFINKINGSYIGLKAGDKFH